MKQKFGIILAALMLALAGCQPNAQTPAEQYLASHSEQEIIDYFEQLIFTYENFNTPSELTNTALIDFATGGVCHNGPLNLERWYNEERNAFLVPTAEIYAVLDKYFASYNFKPERCWYYDYDAENDILAISAVGGGSAASYDLISAEALDADTIKITLLAYTDEETKYTNPYYHYITAKIIGENAQFTSYQSDYDKPLVKRYLDNLTDKEIAAYFQKVCIIADDFANPQEIPSNELLRFAAAYGKLNYNPQDQLYHISLTEISTVLDKYFAEYNFIPSECSDADYNAEKQEFTMPDFAFASLPDAYYYDHARSDGDTPNSDIIWVHLINSADNNTASQDIYITARLIDGQPRFLSRQTVEQAAQP